MRRASAVLRIEQEQPQQTGDDFIAEVFRRRGSFSPAEARSSNMKFGTYLEQQRQMMFNMRWGAAVPGPAHAAAYNGGATGMVAQPAVTHVAPAMAHMAMAPPHAPQVHAPPAQGTQQQAQPFYAAAPPTVPAGQVFMRVDDSQVGSAESM